ncbi:glomulin-like isoform X1 [Lineus longissimus]|uniref:glomulin-like isoform X1 n=1 Tax=Lineus longissimus TaxID=88925 RepID=UPI00315C9B90
MVLAKSCREKFCWLVTRDIHTDLIKMGGDNTDNRNLFIVHIKTLIDSKKVTELRECFFNDENKGVIGEIGWDLVPVLCDRITDDDERDCPDLIEFCVQGLRHVAEIGPPKELLLGLLEQADTFKDDVKLKVLLTAVQVCLLRLPAKRQYSLEIAMETLFAHVDQLEVPEAMDLEGDEKMLLDCDPRVSKLAGVIQALLDFLQPFVDEVPLPSKQTPANSEQKKIIVKQLVKMLGDKLVFLDLSVSDKGTKSEIRLCAEQLMKFMSHLCRNFHNATYWLTEMTEPSGDEGEDQSLNEPLPLLGVSCFLYLVHVEGLGISQYPRVYRPGFILNYSLPFLMLLNENDRIDVKAKGIQMLVKLVQNIEKDSLKHDVWLDNQCFTRILRDLIKITVFCPQRELRQTCVKLLPNLVRKFESRGKRELLFFLLKASDHSGFRGFITQLVKDDLNRMFNTTEPDFTSNDLEKFFRVIFGLKHGAETDLLENSDSIMAALNLMRFLFIRDKPASNVSGIWSRAATLEKEYFDPLRVGLNMSRAHYKLELENVQKETKERKKPEGIEFMVGGTPLPSMPRDQQLTVLETALHTFDMMSTVLVRVEELIEQGKKS